MHDDEVRPEAEASEATQPEPQGDAPESQPASEVAESQLSGEAAVIAADGGEAAAQAAAPAEPSPEETPVPPAAVVPERGYEPFSDLLAGTLVPGAARQSTTASGVPAPESPLLGTGTVAGVDMGPERRFNWWLWGGVVFSLLVIAGIAAGWWWLTMRPIAVPELVGDQVAQATQSLNDSGLRLGKVSQIATAAAPVGSVLEQRPAAGSELGPGDSVSLVVAAPADRAEVPDVSGKQVSEADNLLAAAKLASFHVETFSTTATAGTVMGQVPSTGLLLSPGTYVAIVVSKGAPVSQVIVPNVKGMNGDDAKATLEALGLKGAGYRAVDPSTTAGQTIAQSPEASQRVAPGTYVQFAMSDGAVSSPVTVPSITGVSRTEAERQLKDLGLKPKAIVVSSASAVKDQVFQQMPASGAKVARESSVGFLVSKGMLTEGPVPGVTGKSSEEASKTLGAAGFKPVILDLVHDGATKDKVFAQWPAASQSWLFSYPVVVLVAK